MSTLWSLSLSIILVLSAFPEGKQLTATTCVENSAHLHSRGPLIGGDASLTPFVRVGRAILVTSTIIFSPTFAVQTLFTALLVFVAAVVLHRVVYIVGAIKRAPGIPIYWRTVSPFSPLSAVFPQTWWNPTAYHAWSHMDRYAQRECESLLVVPLLIGIVDVHLASPEALKQILSDLKTWTKPDVVLGLNMMGPNVISAGGEQWRRHRRITAPAFDNQVYINVWNVTTRLYRDMLNSEAWKSEDTHHFAAFNKFTTRLALLVIAATGFNLNIAWDEQVDRKDLTKPVDWSIVTVSTNLLPLVILPKWVWKLPLSWVRKLDTAVKEVHSFLISEVAEKKRDLAFESKTQEKLTATNRNLFERVVMASDQDGSKGLDEDEITGNLFIYLFAGHETTAAVLTANVALLAANQGVQNELCEFIYSTFGECELIRRMRITDSWCRFEAMRLYPAATNMNRINTAATTLTAPRVIPSGSQLRLSRGTQVVFDIIGASRSPRHFADPHAFRPSRRTESSEAMDNFLAFSAGPRLCLGKKFVSVEGVAFLGHLLRDWKLDMKLTVGETRADWTRKVLMNPELLATLKLRDVHVVLTRRQAAGR